jgi:hypothetical protein
LKHCPDLPELLEYISEVQLVDSVIPILKHIKLSGGIYNFVGEVFAMSHSSRVLSRANVQCVFETLNTNETFAGLITMKR